MKTTVELSPALLEAARRISTQEGTTLRALIEEGLRKVLADRERRQPFRLNDGSFAGEGVRSDVDEGSWEQLRGVIYEGRGS